MFRFCRPVVFCSFDILNDARQVTACKDLGAAGLAQYPRRPIFGRIKGETLYGLGAPQIEMNGPTMLEVGCSICLTIRSSIPWHLSRKGETTAARKSGSPSVL